jgi:hypothetical protein
MYDYLFTYYQYAQTIFARDTNIYHHQQVYKSRESLVYIDHDMEGGETEECIGMLLWMAMPPTTALGRVQDMIKQNCG